MRFWRWVKSWFVKPKSNVRFERTTPYAYLCKSVYPIARFLVVADPGEGALSVLQDAGFPLVGSRYEFWPHRKVQSIVKAVRTQQKSDTLWEVNIECEPLK
jgi:hypothetical protein